MEERPDYCPICGYEDLDEDDENWICPECGYTMAKDGEYIEDDDDDSDRVPFGCAACGGDYPNCKDSCPIFDN